MASTENALRDLRFHAKDVEDAYERRYAMIKAAYEAGHTTAEIASALGINRVAVERFMGRRGMQA